MPDLPTGTVTFLFTDIEGSTRLWEQHPEAMPLALTRHNQLLRQAIEAHGGHVFKTVGDQFCAAFAAAPDALAAALAAQQALQTEAWPQTGPLSVRVALHTGTAQEREGDYFGGPLNRVARLLETGHGAQALLSQTTCDLARDHLPEGASLRDLGTHRLKDLQQPEHLFQLLHPSLPAEFPPLRSLEAFAHNLPTQLTSFIGREEAMAQVKELLATARLLTLTGSGGCGKTRLALQVATDLLEEYPDGVWLAELAPLADPTLVPQTVASVLGVREEPGRPLTETLVDYLKPKALLLVMDNCEHLLAACASLAESWLRACPRLRILASSREGLGVAGEQTCRVPSLSVPDPQFLPSPERLQGFEAVQLFAARAALSQPGFVVTEANAAVVAQVCRRLDGIPLAIELAAARVKALPVEKVAERLDDRFRLLTGGSRTALPRQQTLRALIDWSYDLLTEPERTLLRRLSVFSGGWTLEAAEAICAGEPMEAWEVLDLLTQLVEKSLVLYEQPEGEARYRLLETVRQYGRERLTEAGEAAAVRGRHLHFFVLLAEKAEPKLNGHEQAEWLDRLEQERDNFRAALEWSEAADGGTQAALRLVAATRGFWQLRYHRREGLEWLEQALARCTGEVTTVRAKALYQACILCGQAGEPREKAEAFHRESLAIYLRLGDKRGLALTLPGEEGVALAREVGDQTILAQRLMGMSLDLRDQLDWERMEAAAEDLLALSQELGNTISIAAAYRQIGRAAMHREDYARAKACFSEDLSRTRLLGDVDGVAIALGNLADVAIQEGDHPRAQALCAERLTLARKMGHQWHTVHTLERLVMVASAQQQVVRAVRLFGAVQAWRDATGSSPADTVATWRMASGSPRLNEESITPARSTLGEEAFAAAWAEGRAMSLDEAVACALAETADG